MHAALIYPHQLFRPHPALKGCRRAVLVEEPLFFRQYRFHRQKLILHRASMKRFADDIAKKRIPGTYVEERELEDARSIAPFLSRLGIKSVQYVDPSDDWLADRLAAGLAEAGIGRTVLNDPHFLTTPAEFESIMGERDSLYFTSFYVSQRKRLGMLLDSRGKPIGGKWSFDSANRRRLPKEVRVPALRARPENRHVREARRHVRERFPQAIGSDGEFRYPIDHRSAGAWLSEFVETRLDSFGDYEDAISRSEAVLFHSVLTPMLNIGLVSPRQVLDKALLRFGEAPLNSLEGFVRQLIGWREFVRLVYLTRGRRQRTRNFWRFTRPMPAEFYDGTTGIEPVDTVIRRVLQTGYCHHIERLMILGNFMLLCEIDPDAVYRWFMEMFIDAYDWVMVPNVYGMSQYSDGGLMTTKPYISGSSYVLRMSDFQKGSWCAVWDALYWRFIDEHADVFARNPRMAVMVKMRDRLGRKLKEHRRTAETFLGRLHGAG